MALGASVGLGFGPATAPTAPAVPTLAVADDADGTITATITTSTTGSTNEVFHQSVDLEIGTGAWTSGGSRTSDGTVGFSLTVGYYWFKVVSTLNGQTECSNMVYLHVTSGADEIYKQIIDAVQAKIRTLSLTTILNANIVIQKVWNPDTQDFPSIQITTPSKQTMNHTAGTNERDDVVYPILIRIIDYDNQDQGNEWNTYLKWYGQIARAFRNQPLTAVSEVYTCYARPVDTVDDRLWEKEGSYVAGLVLEFISRETRGV